MNELPQSDSSELKPNAGLARRDFLKYAGVVGGTIMALGVNHAFTQPGPKSGANAKQSDHEARKCFDKNGALSAKDCPLATGVAAYDSKRILDTKTFPNLAKIEGISQNQLNQHLALYQGYVKKINDIQGQINAGIPYLGVISTTQNLQRDLPVEQTFALNGAVLHEYYFENIGGKTPPSEILKQLISKEFGNWNNYINHLMTLGKSARGWVVTAYNLRDHRIHNYLMDAHNQLVPFYVMPILVMDVYEHAYMIDFGTKRPAYLDAFMANVNWSKIEERLETMLWHSDKKSGRTV